MVQRGNDENKGEKTSKFETLFINIRLHVRHER